MKNRANYLILILVCLSFITSYAKPSPNKREDNWQVFFNNSLLKSSFSEPKMVQLQMIAKSDIFKITYSSENQHRKSSFIDIYNKNNQLLKSYEYKSDNINLVMEFKVADFYDSLSDDEKLTICYHEENKKGGFTEKVKLVEITF